MGFTLSVIYRVENLVDRTLILEVAGVLDPAGRRPTLVRGGRLAIDLDHPDPIFRNEAHAFLGRGVAAVNIPGVGCDIAGFVAAGEASTEGFLIAGDFVGAEAALQQADVRVFEIATGLLSALLTKAHFQHRADHDRLTGLMSSARIRAELEHCLQRCAGQPRGALTVALADVDHFKQINDHHGHLTGDAVLEEMGRLIVPTLRAGRDHAGRYGGDEFLIILEQTSPEEARAFLERLRERVQQYACGSIAPTGHARTVTPLAVTISVGAGFVGCDGPIPLATGALAVADRALYAAKEAGRNRIVSLESRGSDSGGPGL